MSERISRPFWEGFNEWVQSTQKIKKDSVDLVVWAEGAVPYAMNALNHQGFRANRAVHRKPAGVVRQLT